MFSHAGQVIIIQGFLHSRLLIINDYITRIITFIIFFVAMIEQRQYIQVNVKTGQVPEMAKYFSSD